MNPVSDGSAESIASEAPVGTADDGLFGKLLNLAHILELNKVKRTAVLLYGLACFHLGKADLQSFDSTAFA